MKFEALKKFRDKLARGESVVGLWVTLESASITEMAVALGLDWVVIDAEHGHLDWKEINEHIRAGLRSETVVLVRLAERSTSLAKRALDIGADGVVIPWVETADELREAIRDCRYPPEGRRGIGGERASVWGQCFGEHTAQANDNVLVVPLIESVGAIPHVAEMCKVDGVEVFFFGPADFSATAGFRGQWEGPGVAQQILDLKETIISSGKHCGLLATSLENLSERVGQGFRMPGLGADSGLLFRSLHQTLQAIGRDRRPATSLDPRDGQAIPTPLSHPPEETRPDREEFITHPEESSPIQLQPGVVFRPLAGSFNSSRNLTTGVAHLQPEASLSYHRHPCSESITVLEGHVEVAVEGRAYRLGPFDNIVIPRWLPHSTRNLSADQPARLHNAFGMGTPEREAVSREFERIEMPPASTGHPGAERVTRWKAEGKRQKAEKPGLPPSFGQNVDAIDLFNAELVPGIEMSGELVRIEPQGRLLPHLLDVDGSACVIEGAASCLVEGRRHTLSDCATAVIPHGSVHAFINESDSDVVMISAHAGPSPQRTVIEDAWLQGLFKSG